MIKKINTARFPLLNTDAGLLLLRVWAGIVLLAKHGLEKVIHFSSMQHHFPDPVHVGATTGLVFALLADAVCSVLIAIGLFTRIAAFLQVINLLTVFLFMHHFSFAGEHAEVVYLYLGVYLTILLCGAGRFSIDGMWWSRTEKRRNVNRL